MLQIMKGLVEDVMYVSQGEILMYGEDVTYQWSCEYPSITSRYDQLVRA